MVETAHSLVPERYRRSNEDVRRVLLVHNIRDAFCLEIIIDCLVRLKGHLISHLKKRTDRGQTVAARLLPLDEWRRTEASNSTMKRPGIIVLLAESFDSGVTYGLQSGTGMRGNTSISITTTFRSDYNVVQTHADLEVAV